MFSQLSPERQQYVMDTIVEVIGYSKEDYLERFHTPWSKMIMIDLYRIPRCEVHQEREKFIARRIEARNKKREKTAWEEYNEVKSRWPGDLWIIRKRAYYDDENKYRKFYIGRRKATGSKDKIMKGKEYDYFDTLEVDERESPRFCDRVSKNLWYFSRQD